jgi:Flp pilus assembly pilin Flp
MRETCRDEERGAGLVEYALLVALISVVSIAAITQIQDDLALVFLKASDKLAVVDATK